MYNCTLEEFKEDCMANDFNFEYKEKEYWLTFDRGQFITGECMTDEENHYNSFEDMIDAWIIEGERLKDIYKKIEKV